MTIGATDHVFWAALAVCLLLGAIHPPDVHADPGSDISKDNAKTVDSRPAVPEIDRSPRAWWAATLENLLRGIELSAPQQAGVDAILDDAAADRARARRLREVVQRAREQELSERERSAMAELRQLSKRLTPARRIDAIAELLEPEQREIFDRNRRLRSDRLYQKQRAARSAQMRKAAGISGEEDATQRP